MRLYPYTIEEISSSLANYILFENDYYLSHFVIKDYNNPEKLSFKNSLPLVLADSTTTETRALVEMEDYLNAFRDDFKVIRKPELKEEFENKNTYAIFSKFNNPKYFYNFDRLRQLFVNQIIPSQMYKRTNYKELPIFFSPFQLNVFEPG